jgi:glycosyltransferase involved in cell wall biosynthesis
MEDNNIILSIIIPVYKVEAYIEKCLDSIVTGGNTDNIEVIVIDDGSPDNSGLKADLYADEYPFIKVIHKANEGVATARNTGIENARGEWLYFVDSDDWLADDALDAICKRIKSSHDTDILLFDAYKDTDMGVEKWEHFGNGLVFDSEDDLHSLQRGMLYFPMCDSHTLVPLAAPWDKVYRRQFIMDNRIRFASNLKVLDDMVFNMEAFGSAKRVAYYKDKIYHYRHVEVSITNSYRPDRVSQDMAVWKYIESYMAENSNMANDKFRQAYYCRIVKSFSICCRLNFFNSQNEKSLPDKLGYVKKVMATEPYKSAFKYVKLKNAEWKLQVMIIMVRLKSSFGVWILHIAQNGIK